MDKRPIIAVSIIVILIFAVIIVYEGAGSLFQAFLPKTIVGEIWTPETPRPGIADSVTPLDSSVVEVDRIEIKIVGIDYGKEVTIKRKGDWRSSDDRGILDSAAQSFGEGIGVGMAKAITGQEDEEKHMDGELVIYFEMVNKNQRPRTPDIQVRVFDDKETEYTIYKTMQSFGHSPMQPGEKYLESVWLKAYSDVKYFQVLIGDTLFTIDAPEFKGR